MSCLLRPCKTELLAHHQSGISYNLTTFLRFFVLFLLHLLSHGKFWMYTHPVKSNSKLTIWQHYKQDICHVCLWHVLMFYPCIHILSLLYGFSKIVVAYFCHIYKNQTLRVYINMQHNYVDMRLIHISMLHGSLHSKYLTRLLLVTEVTIIIGRGWK